MPPKPRPATNLIGIGPSGRLTPEPQVLKVPQPDQHSGTVLIADNDKDVLRQVGSIVEGLGFVAIAAPDGREAQRRLSSSTDFVAGIFELVLPHCSGPDLIRHMMRDENLKRVPVIIMTGTNSTRMCSESFNAGAKAFLPKPFRTSQLQALLMTIVGKRRAAMATATINTQALGLSLINQSNTPSKIPTDILFLPIVNASAKAG